MLTMVGWCFDAEFLLLSGDRLAAQSKGGDADEASRQLADAVMKADVEDSNELD